MPRAALPERLPATWSQRCGSAVADDGAELGDAGVYVRGERVQAPLGSRRSRRGRIDAMIEEMATVRITEAELARDIHAVLAKVQEASR